MSALAAHPIFVKLQANRDLLFPVAFVALLGVILVPLPTPVLDFLLIVNLALSIVVLATTIYVKSPLEFAVFPSLLLAVTLFRLVLNVATTRLILTAGDNGRTPEQAAHAAGEMVHAFSSLVTAGSLAVGVIIFVIIFIIQFVVITKGATRISEVAARFTLDAMPGKQMAIDADVNAGVIDEPTARKRREEVAQEADFYGAMDGASKFVRGDAVAGIVITAINIVGGAFVGMYQHGWSLGPTAELYTKLTIGDGLVSQIPAFITSMAAGLIITRSSSRKQLGEEFAAQMFAQPQALVVTAIFLVALMLTGLPALPLAGLAAACGFGAWKINQNRARVAVAQQRAAVETEQQARREPEKVEALLAVDPLELTLGAGLVRLVDPTKGGDLLDRISGLRRRLAGELGIVVPPVRIRDDATLDTCDYAVKLRGEAIARGVVYPEQFLAMQTPVSAGPIPHAELTTEPAFGLPAYWISDSQRGQADLLNYTVIEAPGVLATHLTEVLRAHAHELLTRQGVKELVDNLKQKSPALVEEVVPAVVKPGELQKVMQNLLRERVPVRDLETIVEVLGDFAPRTRDLDVLTEYARNALARTICKAYVDEQNRLWCVTLDPALEEMVAGATANGAGLAPQVGASVARKVGEKIGEIAQGGGGRSPVVLVAPNVRAAMRRLIEGGLPGVGVLAYNEVVSDVNVEAAAIVTLSG